MTTKDPGRVAQAADVAAARAAAAAADRTAQEAREEATVARQEAAEASDQVASSDADALAEDLLRDHEPGQGTNAFGRPGRPLARHSPFYIGFFGAVGVLVAVALANLVSAARSVLVLVVVALFIAVGLNPLVERLILRGVRRSVAVLVVCLCTIVVLALFVIAIAPVLTDQVARIGQSAPEWLDELRRNETIHDLNARYGVIDRLETQLTNGTIATSAFGGIVGVGKIVLGALFSVLTVFVLTLYFLASLPQIKRACYRLVPASRRPRVAVLGDEILIRVGGYLGAAFIVATIAGLAAMVFCYAVGLGEYAVALGVVVALFDFIPLVGATIAAVIVSLIGFVNSPGIGIACVVFFVIYQQVENYLIYPRVMSSSVDVPGAAVVIAVLLGGALLGVIGALLAIPTTAALMLIAREVVVRRQDAT